MNRITADAQRLEQLREADDPGFVVEVERFYLPYRDLATRVGRGDVAAVGPALAFLEADPRCFRSGYMKADLMHALANGPNLQPVRARVQAVVLHRVRHHEPRLLRHAARLACEVWDDELESAIRELQRDGDERQCADARQLLDWVEQQVPNR
jgi:hypothetical protein